MMKRGGSVPWGGSLDDMGGLSPVWRPPYRKAAVTPRGSVAYRQRLEAASRQCRIRHVTPPDRPCHRGLCHRGSGGRLCHPGRAVAAFRGCASSTLRLRLHDPGARPPCRTLVPRAREGLSRQRRLVPHPTPHLVPHPTPHRRRGDRPSPTVCGDLVPAGLVTAPDRDRTSGNAPYNDEDASGVYVTRTHT